MGANHCHPLNQRITPHTRDKICPAPRIFSTPDLLPSTAPITPRIPVSEILVLRANRGGGGGWFCGAQLTPCTLQINFSCKNVDNEECARTFAIRLLIQQLPSERNLVLQRPAVFPNID